jgi:hypothetical protein
MNAILEHFNFEMFHARHADAWLAAAVGESASHTDGDSSDAIAVGSRTDIDSSDSSDAAAQA